MIRAAGTLAGCVCLLTFVDTVGASLGAFIVGNGKGVLA